MRGRGKGMDIQTLQNPYPSPQGYRGLRSPVVKKIIHYFFGECLV